MALTSLIIYLSCYLSFNYPIFSFLLFCATLMACKKFLIAYQIPLYINILNLYKALIPNPYIYNDFITYNQIPKDENILNFSSYWASSFDYFFSVFIKIFYLLDISIYDGFLILLSILVSILFNLVSRFRNNLYDAIFFLLCYSYTTSFQLTRYTIAVSIAYFLYLRWPHSISAAMVSFFILIQFHFYSIINYIICKLNYKKIFISILIIMTLINLGMGGQFIELFPDLGKYSEALYSPSDSLKSLSYILVCCSVFFIKSPSIYLDPIKKMVAISLIFFFINSTLSERMLVLPFYIFFGLIFSYIIVGRHKIFYFLPFSLFCYRYLPL